jgi:hypothetical protein
MPMWINALMRTLATAELFHMLGVQLGKGTLLVGMVYDYLPFMIYPIYNILNKMDKSYAEAAEALQRHDSRREKAENSEELQRVHLLCLFFPRCPNAESQTAGGAASRPLYPRRESPFPAHTGRFWHTAGNSYRIRDKRA